jgi:hypothetical protein
MTLTNAMYKLPEDDVDASKHIAAFVT